MIISRMKWRRENNSWPNFLAFAEGVRPAVPALVVWWRVTTAIRPAAAASAAHSSVKQWNSCRERHLRSRNRAVHFTCLSHTCVQGVRGLGRATKGEKEESLASSHILTTTHVLSHSHTHIQTKQRCSLTNHMIGHVDLDLTFCFKGHLAFDTLICFLLQDNTRDSRT